MRFIHVNHRYAPFVGGSELFIKELSERFVRTGHAVEVVTTDAFDLEYFWDARRVRVDAPPRETVAGVQVRRVPVRHIPGSSIVFRGTRRLMGELSRAPIAMHASAFAAVSRAQPWLPGLARGIECCGPADLIHATNIGLEGLALRARDAACKQDVPFVLTPFIHLGDARSALARRYVSMPHQRALLQAAMAVLTMTEAEAQFVASLGVRTHRIHVVGAGIEPGTVTGGDGDSFRARHAVTGTLVAAIGALAEDKGTMTLVRAVAQLRRAGRDVDLVLAGPALTGFTRWYTALPETERQGIHILGFIDNDEKRDLLAAMDMLALPSRTESFGIVYLEAWANAKPVIAARAGAVPELVRDGENGLLVPFGDVEALARAIDILARDTPQAGMLGAQGCKVTLGKNTWSHVFRRVERAYGSALGFATSGGAA